MRKSGCTASPAGGQAGRQAGRQAGSGRVKCGARRSAWGGAEAGRGRGRGSRAEQRTRVGVEHRRARLLGGPQLLVRDTRRQRARLEAIQQRLGAARAGGRARWWGRRARGPISGAVHARNRRRLLAASGAAAARSASLLRAATPLSRSTPLASHLSSCAVVMRLLRGSTISKKWRTRPMYVDRSYLEPSACGSGGGGDTRRGARLRARPHAAPEPPSTHAATAATAWLQPGARGPATRGRRPASPAGAPLWRWTWRQRTEAEPRRGGRRRCHRRAAHGLPRDLAAHGTGSPSKRVGSSYAHTGTADGEMQRRERDTEFVRSPRRSPVGCPALEGTRH